jgi:hypothetical protein
MKSILVATVAFGILGSVLQADEPKLIRSELASLVDCRGHVARTIEQCARDAVSQDAAVAQSAIRELRGRGPDGFHALLEAHAEALRQHETNRIFTPNKLQPDENWFRLKTALDGVSGQRDCHASKLFWFTDFEQAKAAARASDKPILSLRLLGKLDEEFSCANSRFFRTTLYANAEIARYLNDHFILHWKSVRPVPKVTIDFGDGRKLERTLTGNSIHYVLDADGRVIDALPGLYGAQTFLRELERAETVARVAAQMKEPAARETALRDYHRTRLNALSADYSADLQRAKVELVQVESAPRAAITPVAQPPTAIAAGKRAGGKGRVEMPILRRTASEAESDEAIWQRIGNLHVEEARVDASSRALIAEKAPSATVASRATASKTITETPLLRQIRNFERSISEDTARNEYLFHTRIHEWLANDAATLPVDQLNSRVYAQLFLTPESDPWLGLRPDDTFAALENDGIVLNKR